jgi:hypothetical protein
LCTDWKGENPLGATAQTFDKFRPIKRGWVALMAGKSTRALELVREYQGYLPSQDISDENAIEVVKIATHRRVAKLKNELVKLTLGVSYEHFRKEGFKQFGEKVFKETIDEVKKVDLGASVIVAGFTTSKHPILLVVNRGGFVTREEHFAAIGDGKIVAVPTLVILG